MELHVAVEQGHAGIVGGEVDVHFLEPAQHGNIFNNAASRLAADAGELEAVPMQVHGWMSSEALRIWSRYRFPFFMWNIGVMFIMSKATPLIVQRLNPLSAA